MTRPVQGLLAVVFAFMAFSGSSATAQCLPLPETVGYVSEYIQRLTEPPSWGPELPIAAARVLYSVGCAAAEHPRDLDNYALATAGYLATTPQRFRTTPLAEANLDFHNSGDLCQCPSASGGGGGGGGGDWSWSFCDSSFSSGFCESGSEPIIFDFGEPGLELSGLDDPVRFDINADGNLDEISWTAKGAPDALLVLDRNGNGVIDDGSELFGDSVTLLDGSTASMGFEALRELDREELGGDGSGVLDDNDRLFRELHLWTDWNHDGRSDQHELRSLRSEGVIALSLETSELMTMDEHGNFFSYFSRAYALQQPQGKGGKAARRRFVEIPTIDVYFLMKRE